MKINGIKLTKQGKSNFNEIYHKRKDPRNNIYFWVDEPLILWKMIQMLVK